MTVNPFRPTRWEHHSDGHPLIWFTPTSEVLAGEKSAYVHGSRGSGKTSLLRSVCWEDLISNPSLRLQRSIVDSRNVGIYVRFPDHISDSMGMLDWGKLFPQAPNPATEYFRFFSLAIELICLEKTLLAVHQLRLDERMSLDAAQELRLVNEVIEEFPPLLQFTDRKPITFVDLSRLFRALVRTMNQASGQGTIAELIQSLPKREPIELLLFVTERLSGVSRLVGAKEGPGFKFCLDDCEVLHRQQLMSINTLVRKSRFPISWVITAVGDALDSGETFMPQQPLTDADRKVISLDARRRADFGNLCEAVASLRTYFSLPVDKRPQVGRRQIAKFFDLERRLGKQDVNDTIGLMIRRSSSPERGLFQEAAEKLREELWTRKLPYKNKYPEDSDRLPFYEAYLLLHWTGLEESFAAAAGREDLQRISKYVDRLKSGSFQAWMRRKMVAALFHLAGSLGFKRLPLSGVNRVVSLADGSIRDFLEILAEIYDAFVGRDGDDDPSGAETSLQFALSGSKIATRLQTTGIYKASESFFAGVSTNAESHPEFVVSLIEVFGKITSELQTNVGDPSTLGRAERGVFVIDTSSDLFFREAKAIDRQVLSEGLKQAELSGYLRSVEIRRGSTTLKAKDQEYQTAGYRLHRRFAPHFRFSYRGAYETIRLDGPLLAEICRRTGTSKSEAWRSLLSVSSPISDHMSLELPWPEELLDD